MGFEIGQWEKHQLSWSAWHGGALDAIGGCRVLRVALYQIACFGKICDAGLRLPLMLRGEVVGMRLWACGVSMTPLVTGEACQPSSKSPWSGGLGKGFLCRFVWT